MKAYGLNLMLVFCLINFIVGCGTSITREVAQSAVDSAQIAIENAKAERADIYSAKEVKNAERLLNEAERALSRNRRQRAYTLANKAEQSARAAVEQARKSLSTAYMPGQFPQPGVLPPSPTLPATERQYAAPYQRPAEPPIASTVPPVAEQPIPRSVEPPPPTIPVQTALPTPDMQNRIQAAVQAIEGAERTLQAARALIVKIQVEIELSSADATIGQLQSIGAPREAINLIQSWYNQARQSSAAGNYENALRFLERARMYAQSLITPTQ